MRSSGKIATRINPQFAWAQLRVDASKIDRLGVFAAETIPRGTKVIRYTGQRITRREAERRLARRWLRQTNPRVYTVRLNGHWVIDGSVGGSGAEFINHSCDPNLTVRKRRGQVLFYTRKMIRAGQELTADYGFRCEPCHCGARTCRGTICAGCGHRSKKR